MYHKLFTVGLHPSWSLNLQICLFSKFTYPQINAYSVFVVIHESQSGEKFESPDEQFPKQGYSKCSAEVLFSVPKWEKTAMCLMEKIRALC